VARLREDLHILHTGMFNRAYLHLNPPFSACLSPLYRATHNAERAPDALHCNRAATALYVFLRRLTVALRFTYRACALQPPLPGMRHRSRFATFPPSANLALAPPRYMKGSGVTSLQPSATCAALKPVDGRAGGTAPAGQVASGTARARTRRLPARISSDSSAAAGAGILLSPGVIISTAWLRASGIMAGDNAAIWQGACLQKNMGWRKWRWTAW